MIELAPVINKDSLKLMITSSRDFVSKYADYMFWYDGSEQNIVFTFLIFTQNRPYNLF